MDVDNDLPTSRLPDPAELYNSFYYRTGCGTPMGHNAEWLGFFGQVADRIVEEIRPVRVLDAGCAMGILVASLRDRGVDAWGIDISPFAIGEVREDVRPFCRVASVCEPPGERFDLITCIEVLEHLDRHDAETAVANFCQHADAVLFSSSPLDFRETTHFNVQLPDYWAYHFARHGLFRDHDFDGGFLTEWAVLFRKGGGHPTRIVAGYERKQWHLAQIVRGNRELLLEQRSQLEKAEASSMGLVGRLAVVEGRSADLADRLVATEAQIVETERRTQAAIESSQADMSARMAEETDRIRLDAEQRILDAEQRILEVTRRREAADRAMIEATRRAADLMGRLASTEGQLAAALGRLQDAEQDLSLTREAATEARLQIDERSREVVETLAYSEQLRSMLADVHASTAVKMARRVRETLSRVAPPGTKRRGLVNLGRQAVHVWRHEGHASFARKGVQRLLRRPRGVIAATRPASIHVATDPYSHWIAAHEPGQDQLDLQRTESAALPHQPAFSILTPIYNTPIDLLDAMIGSVLAQTYARWELCLVDGASTTPGVAERLKTWAETDPRIRVVRLAENLGISGNTNAALEMARGDFIALLDHDDLLAPDALYEMARALNDRSELDILYSDRDLVTADGGRRMTPLFKGEHSPETFLCANYMVHLTVVRTTLARSIGGLNAESDGSQDWDFFLRLLEQTDRVAHIPRILYHWRFWERSVSTGVDNKPYARQGQRVALEGHLHRTGHDDASVAIDERDRVRVHLRPKVDRSVSLIVEADGPADIRRKVSVWLDEAKAGQPIHEMIVVSPSGLESPVENLPPHVRIVTAPLGTGRFAALNLGAEQASADLLVFLGVAVEPRDDGWLAELAQWFDRDGVGMVGPMLVNHGGQNVSYRLSAAFDEEPTLSALINVAIGHDEYGGSCYWYRNVTALPLEGLTITACRFRELGGFESAYRGDGADVALGLKIRAAGLRVMTTPYAKLRTSPARPAPTAADRERLAALVRPLVEGGDPYVNPNLTSCPRG